MNLLDYMNMKAGNLITKATVSEVMSSGTEDEKAAMWEKIMDAGGYDELED